MTTDTPTPSPCAPREKKDNDTLILDLYILSGYLFSKEHTVDTSSRY